MSQSLDTEAMSLKSPVKGPKNVGFQSTSVEDPRVLSVQGKATKLLKVSMEAMIRGYEKMTEPEEKHNVAAWQNAIHPYVSLKYHQAHKRYRLQLLCEQSSESIR
jgi:hypothetical protein